MEDYDSSFLINDINYYLVEDAFVVFIEAVENVGEVAVCLGEVFGC